MKEAKYSKWITENDINRSATVTHLDDLFKALSILKGLKIDRMLDIGCGYGGLPKIVSEYLNVSEVHGIDIDPKVLDEAAGKGITTYQVDVDKDPLPFKETHFDLIVSFGMMDYLPFFDNYIREAFRVLKPGAHILIALPNLASWHNRLMLLMGYQLRDVEVSRKILVGVHPRYKGQDPTGHIHVVTPNAFSELMTYHGFNTIKIMSGKPRQNKINPFVSLIDNIFSMRVNLARRFFYIGRKPESKSD